jgi:hypothetical protein
MVDKYLKDKSQYIEFAGAIACAVFIAYMQSILNRESDQPVETRTLIKYIFLNIGCFSFAFLGIRRFSISRSEPVLSSLLIAVIGAVSSALIIDIPFILNNSGYREISQRNYSGVIQSSITILILNIIIAVLIALFICGIVRLIQKLMMK